MSTKQNNSNEFPVEEDEVCFSHNLIFLNNGLHVILEYVF